MNDDLNRWFSGLSETDRMIYVTYVMGHLTIWGRDFGDSLSGEQQVRAFKGLNELQHQIGNYFFSIHKEHEVYPGDIFLTILREKASYYGLSKHLEATLEYARSRNNWSDDI